MAALGSALRRARPRPPRAVRVGRIAATPDETRHIIPYRCAGERQPAFCRRSGGRERAGRLRARRRTACRLRPGRSPARQRASRLRACRPPCHSEVLRGRLRPGISSSPSVAHSKAKTRSRPADRLLRSGRQGGGHAAFARAGLPPHGGSPWRAAGGEPVCLRGLCRAGAALGRRTPYRPPARPLFTPAGVRPGARDDSASAARTP
jgi:hypothetical protein